MGSSQRGGLPPPPYLVPTAPPIEDEVPGAEGADGTDKGVRLGGATGGAPKAEAMDSDDERHAAAPWWGSGPNFGTARVRTRSQKAKDATRDDEKEMAQIGTYPSRDYPGPGGVQAIYRPWSSELRAIVNEMPKMCEDPQKFQREL